MQVLNRPGLVTGHYLIIVLCYAVAHLMFAAPLRALPSNRGEGLVAHWAFNDLSGPMVRDSSTNGLAGTLAGGVWTNGISLYDSAVNFSGSSQALFIPAAGTPPPAQIASLRYGSIAIRFRFAASASGDIIPLLYFGEAHSNALHKSLILVIGHASNPSDRRLYFTIINASFCFDTGTNLLPNTWYDFVAVVRPDGNTGYLNGRELTQRHYNLGCTPTNSSFFSSVPVPELLSVAYGRYGADYRFFYGPATISDLSIYNRPLTGDEISQFHGQVDDPGVFRARPPVPCADHSGLVLSWPSATNYHYSIFRTRTMRPALWEPLTNFQDLPATPPLNASTIPLDSAASGFLQIEAHPPGS